MNSKIRDKLNWMINIKQPCLYWLQGSYRTAPKLKLFEIILLNWGCIVDSEPSHFSPTIFFFNLHHIFSFIGFHFWNLQKIFIFLMTIHLSGLFLLITKGNLSNVNVLQRYGYQVLDYPVPTPVACKCPKSLTGVGWWSN